MRLILICFILLCTQLSFAQNYLVIKHRTKQKEVVLEEGRMLVAVAFDGEKVRGPLKIISEHVIQIKNKIVPLTNVKKIGAKDPWIMKIGSLVTSNGANLLVYGLNDNLSNGWDRLSALHKAALPMLAAGLPVMLISRKRNIKHWTYSTSGAALE